MKLVKMMMAAAVALVVVGCGKIPSAYQGEFVDAAAGVKLKLGGADGELVFADGRKLEAKADDHKFEIIKEGKQGIFLGQNPRNDKLIDFFWLNPNLATRQEVEGFVWYTSEVLYTIVDTKREEQVPSVQFFHCMDGHVMLDLTTQQMQMGCPAGPKQYTFVRGKSDEKPRTPGSTGEIQRL